MKPQRGTSQHKAQFMILTFHIRRYTKQQQHQWNEKRTTHTLVLYIRVNIYSLVCFLITNLTISAKLY